MELIKNEAQSTLALRCPQLDFSAVSTLNNKVKLSAPRVVNHSARPSVDRFQNYYTGHTDQAIMYFSRALECAERVHGSHPLLGKLVCRFRFSVGATPKMSCSLWDGSTLSKVIFVPSARFVSSPCLIIWDRCSMPFFCCAFRLPRTVLLPGSPPPADGATTRRYGPCGYLRSFQSIYSLSMVSFCGSNPKSFWCPKSHNLSCMHS